MNHFATLSFATFLREQTDAAEQPHEAQTEAPTPRLRPRAASVQRPSAVMAPRKG